MSSATFAVPPASLDDQDHDPAASHHHQAYPTFDEQNQPTTSVDSNLSPLLSAPDSDQLSPVYLLETPGGSNSTLSHGPASDYSDLDDDPFFGADFGAVDGVTPSFLDDQSFAPNNNDTGAYPLTPEQTVSVHTRSPSSGFGGALSRSIADQMPQSISPRDLQKPFQPPPLITDSTQMTPSHSSSCRTSEDGLAPAVVSMSAQSPRVTVSMWGGEDDDHGPVDGEERILDGGSPTTVRAGYQQAGDLMAVGAESGSASGSAPTRDALGRWQRSLSTGHLGLAPEERPSIEVSESPNEAAISRKAKVVVDNWLSNDFNDLSLGPEEHDADAIRKLADLRRDHPGDEIPFDRNTENRHLPGQAYYTGGGGELSPEDLAIIASTEPWDNGPRMHPIRKPEAGARRQPETAQAAIHMFEKLCGDNDSLLTRNATWGTRRRSFSSVMDFEKAGTTGNFLKKLSISRGESNKKPNPLMRLLRRPSAASILKRTRTGNSDDSQPASDEKDSQESTKRDSLTPLGRMPSLGKKPTPSLNTALVSMAHGMAAVGATTHSRSGSISATPITSPKSPFGGLAVKASLRRPRSKSDLPKATPPAVKSESHSSLVAMWRESGGPPVAVISKKPQQNEADDDDDDEDDILDDSDMKMDANLIDKITPNVAGFEQHLLILNPDLAHTNNYLVQRIARNQEQRYKGLLKAKIAHLKLGATCPSGRLCASLGGSVTLLDHSNDIQELDPRSTGFNDGDGTPTEGAINPESFPKDIPMPPAERLPAEFECQLCFQSKKFQKPSDWTKHVHEDVQPFTCTWDKCRDPKMFKRKADWVRHENEGHRHLEWWTCDVEGCRHRCFRRDNFLQHLVREHKFPEPKVKTKAAQKRLGGTDPTWQKVEQCHVDTTVSPQEEPCRFCSRTFPTWKKLTVHLAKHMEQISLPVLRLVDAKAAELKADTVISPLQDPPPPTSAVMTPVVQFPSFEGHQQLATPSQTPFQNQGAFVYPVMPAGQFHQPGMYHQQQQQYESIGQNLQQSSMGFQSMGQGFGQHNSMQDMAVSTSSNGYVPVQHNTQTYASMGSNGMETFQQMNALGLQNQSMPMGQMSYDGMMDPASGTVSPFSGQGSVSPYLGHTHSPDQPQTGGNVNGAVIWDEQQTARFQ